MMNTPSWQQDYEKLLASDDEAVRGVGENLAETFRDPTKQPPPHVYDKRDAIIAAVRICFPSQFAIGFESWLEESERLPAIVAENPDHILYNARVSKVFKSYFDAFWKLWLQLTSFLPFIFMTTINRLDQNILKDPQTGKLDSQFKKGLQKAHTYYEQFYYPQKEGRGTEAVRRDLLAALLDLFRRLDKKQLLDDKFVLYPLVKKAGDFARLIPDRFEAHLRLIQEVRNDIAHRELDNRIAEILAPLGRLLEVVFLDVVDILRPVFEAYQLAYIIATRSEGSGRVADAIAFSGFSNTPTPLPLRVPGIKRYKYQIMEDELYLVRRGAESDPEASPVDYLNLTPFLIYQRLLALQDSKDREHLFVFHEYRKKKSVAVYREFAGNEALTVQLGKLIERIEQFREDLKSRVPAELVSDTDWDLVFMRTWEISDQSLKSVMNPNRYDATGALLPDANAEVDRRTFVEELFVPPAEDSVADKFFASSHRGLVLTGPSGAGKSNLLCHWFLRARRADRPAVFLTGRLIDTPSFDQELLDHVVKEIKLGWGFQELDEVLARRGESLLVIVDAVNEFTGERGALALLQKIIAFVGNEPAFRRVQFVIGCREETWKEYENKHGLRPLNPRYFCQPDALQLAALEDEKLRERMYANYQQHFRLQPESYAQLSPTTKSLIRLPLMMALLAETYAGKAADGGPAQGGTVIPWDVDYFTLFKSLTERKLEDALCLLGSSREDEVLSFKKRVEDALRTFARVVYERLIAVPNLSSADMLPYTLLCEDTRLAPFTAVRAAGGVSPLDAALQVGLLERSFVTEDADPVRRFFHDEYAQYWLSQVYDRGVLQPAGRARGAPPEQLERLADEIRKLLERSARAPLLEGALDHWLHAGLKLPPTTGEDLLLSLLDRLAVDESSAVRYFVQAFLARLLRRGVVAPKDLFGVLFREGSRELTTAVAEMFLENWRDLTSQTLQAFFQALRPPHKGPVLARLGDVFARLFIDAADETAAYLDGVLKPVDRLRDLAGVVLDIAARQRELQFMLEFVQRALPAIWDRQAHGTVLRALLWKKYRSPINALMKTREGKKGSPITRSVLNPLLEKAGIRAWEQFGTGMPMSGNNQFFEADRGVVQRDLVRELVPYAVAFHNGELTAESLAPGQPLRALILRMLNHRVTSVAGFLAALLVPIVLRQRPEEEPEEEVVGLIEELIRNTTDSGRFFGNLILAHLAYLVPDRSAEILAILRKLIVPWFTEWRPEDQLNCPLNWEWPTLFTLCITAGDPKALWPNCRKILTEIFANLDGRGDPTAASHLGDHLLKASFPGDGILGRHVLEMLIEDGRLEAPLWREAVLKVAAGLLARSPALLRETLKNSRADGAIEREARGYLSKDVLYHRDTFSGQVAWDRAIVNMLAYDARFRYLLIQDLMGGLARAQDTADIGVAVRRAIVNTAVVIFAKEPDECYSQLAVDEVLGA